MPDPVTGTAIVVAAGAAIRSGAATELAKGGVRAARALWDSLLRPGAQQLGLALADSVAEWRTRNVVETTARAAGLFEDRQVDAHTVHVHPRLGAVIYDQCSWTDDDVLRDMWAGLLVSSASPEGDDDANLMFTDLLSKLTRSQARILDHVCRTASKKWSKEGFVVAAEEVFVPLTEMQQISGLAADITRLDRELDHLVAIGLIKGPGGIPFLERGPDDDFEIYPFNCSVTPSPLALQLVARAHGFKAASDMYRREEGPAKE
jgi:hypothetical protein